MKRYTALLVLTTAVIPFYNAFTVSTQTLSIEVDQVRNEGPLTFAATNKAGNVAYDINTPAMHYGLRVNFTAQGAFSVNNPVTVDVRVINPNVTKAAFMEYYGAVQLTGATIAGPNEKEAQFNFTRVINETGYVNGQLVSYIVYIASSTVVWKETGQSWLFLEPPSAGGLGIATTKVQQGNSTITISDVADTLSVNNNRATLFLTWILVGFSVLMLQPILEAVLIRDDKNLK